MQSPAERFGPRIEAGIECPASVRDGQVHIEDLAMKSCPLVLGREVQVSGVIESLREDNRERA